MDYVAFGVVAFVLVATPGPDSFLIVNNTLAHGRGAGLATTAGVQIGVMTHGLLSVLGLSALLYYSQTAFGVLVIVGPLYLIWLGAQIMFKSNFFAVPSSPTSPGAAADNRGGGDDNNRGGGNAFAQGLLFNLLNPKVLLIFIVLMPAYVDPDGDDKRWQLAAMALILLSINIPFQCFLVVLSDRVRQWLARPRLMRAVRLALGAALCGLAADIFLAHAQDLWR